MRKLYFFSTLILIAISLSGYSNTSDKNSLPDKHCAYIVVPSFNPMGPYCQGSFIPALPSTSNEGITGTWSPSVIDPNNSGTYLFTPDSMAASPVSVNITIIPIPNVGTLTGNQNICVGLTTTFTSTVTGGTWSSSNPFVASINPVTGVITGVAPGVTTMTYEVNGSGICPNAVATRVVVVNAQPTAGILTGIQTICVGETVQYLSTSPGGAWTSSDTAIATVHPANGQVTGMAAGTAVITYTVLGTGGCVNASTTRNVTVTPTPTLQLTSSPVTLVQTVCLNIPITPITFSVNTTNCTVTNLPPGITGTVSGNVFTISGSPTAVGVFNIGFESSNSCGVLSATGVITVVPNASITLTSGPGTANQTVCINTPIVPIVYTAANGATSASITSGSLPVGISATFNAVSGILTISGTPITEGTFPFAVSTVGGCGTNTSTGTIIVNRTSTPVICNPFPNSITFDWSPIVGATNYSYAYSINSGPIQTGNGAISNYTVSGLQPADQVTFTLTNAVGISCFQPVLATCSFLAAEDFDTDTFGYYPNPVSNVLNLSYQSPITHVEITNMIGQQVFNQYYDSKTVEVNTATFQKGIYLVKVTSGTAVKTIKVIKD